MIRKALILAVVLSSMTLAIYRGTKHADGDPLPFCPPICQP